MAEVSLPPGVATSTVDRIKSESLSGTDAYDSLNMEPALVGPDPGFVFPAREDAPSARSRDSADDERKEQSQSAAIRRRPDHISISKLPPFPFPGPVTPPATQSGEQSPAQSLPISRPGGGHRRGGSEFIGGDGSLSGPGLMSASPTKTEGALPSPAMGGRRRGHAHRRSGAISSHDVSAILKPADPNKLMSGSAPTTPSHSGGAFTERPMLGHAASQPTLPRQIDSPDRSVVESPSETSLPAAQPRPRVVGFSDKLEYIPRPLSTISSATSSSMSTIRPTHSSTGSIVSIPSLAGSSPPSARKLEQFRASSIGGNEHTTSDPFRVEPGLSKLFQRPRTPLGTRLSAEDESQDREISDDQFLDDKNAQSQPSHGGEMLAPSVFSDLNHYPTRRANFPRISSPHDLRPYETPRPRSSPETKVSKSQKKGKPWTGLLSRRHRQHGGARAPAPLGLQATSSEFASGTQSYPEDVDFDNDTTFVVVDETHRQPRSAPANRTNMFHHGQDSDDDVPGAVLDIDEEWRAQDAAQARTKELQKRQLHSSRGFGPFSGSGVPFHRRAESAPVMPAFDSPFTTHRAGGSPQMADVFEEEENEDFATSTRGKTNSANDNSHAKNSTADKALTSALPDPGSQHGSVGYDPTALSEPIKSEDGDGSTGARRTRDEYPQLITKSSGGSSSTTKAAAGDAKPRRPSTVSNNPDPFQELLDMAAEPSPDPAQTSFEVPRLSTGHSSVTDRSVWSSARTGDSASAPFGHSTDDVAPSLTSVSSTRTGPHKAPPASPLAVAHASADPGSGEQTGSARAQSISEGTLLSSAQVQRSEPRPLSSASKRASLISLSRIMGGSSRSKLSIESRATEETGDGEASEAAGGKKKNRISRLVRFFKSRENLKGSSEEGK